MQTVHNIEEGVPHEKAQIHGYNVLPRGIFGHDLAEDEEIIGEFQVYIKAKENGLYPLYMLKMEGKWHPYVVGGERTRLAVTSIGRMFLWKSSVQAHAAPVSPFARFFYSLLVKGKASSEYHWYLLSELSSIERYYDSKRSSSNQYSGGIKLRFGNFGDTGFSKQRTMLFPWFVKTRSRYMPDVKETWYQSLKVVLRMALSAVSYKLVVKEDRGRIVDIKTYNNEFWVSKTFKSGVLDELHDSSSVFDDLVMLEKLLLWSKKTSGPASDDLTADTVPSCCSISSVDFPIIEQTTVADAASCAMPGTDGCRLNINSSTVPFAEGEILVDCIPIRPSLSPWGVVHFLGLALILVVHFFELLNRSYDPVASAITIVFTVIVLLAQVKDDPRLTIPCWSMLYTLLRSSNYYYVGVFRPYHFPVPYSLQGDILRFVHICVYASIVGYVKWKRLRSRGALIITRNRVISYMIRSPNYMRGDNDNIQILVESYFLDNISDGYLHWGQFDMNVTAKTRFGSLEIDLNRCNWPTLGLVKLNLYPKTAGFRNRMISFMLKLSMTNQVPALVTTRESSNYGNMQNNEGRVNEPLNVVYSTTTYSSRNNSIDATTTMSTPGNVPIPLFPDEEQMASISGRGDWKDVLPCIPSRWSRAISCGITPKRAIYRLVATSHRLWSIQTLDNNAPTMMLSKRFPSVGGSVSWLHFSEDVDSPMYGWSMYSNASFTESQMRCLDPTTYGHLDIDFMGTSTSPSLYLQRMHEGSVVGVNRKKASKKSTVRNHVDGSNRNSSSSSTAGRGAVESSRVVNGDEHAMNQVMVGDDIAHFRHTLATVFSAHCRGMQRKSPPMIDSHNSVIGGSFVDHEINVLATPIPIANKNGALETGNHENTVISSSATSPATGLAMRRTHLLSTSSAGATPGEANTSSRHTSTSSSSSSSSSSRITEISLSDGSPTVEHRKKFSII